MRVDLETCKATDEQEAVEKATQYLPHFIIIALVMLVLDGFAAIYQLHQQPQLADTAIIALSTSAFARDRNQACGVDEFLAKPIAIEEFLEKIESLLPIEFLYKETTSNQGSTASEVAVSDSQMVAPLPKELEKFDELALRSHLEAIQKQGATIQQEQTQLILGAQHVYKLAKQFRKRELLQSICQY